MPQNLVQHPSVNTSGVASLNGNSLHPQDFKSSPIVGAASATENRLNVPFAAWKEEYCTGDRSSLKPYQRSTIKPDRTMCRRNRAKRMAKTHSRASLSDRPLGSVAWMGNPSAPTPLSGCVVFTRNIQISLPIDLHHREESFSD